MEIITNEAFQDIDEDALTFIFVSHPDSRASNMVRDVVGVLEGKSRKQTFYEVNKADDPAFVEELGVGQVPCLLYFQGQRELGRIYGYNNIAKFDEFVARLTPEQPKAKAKKG